MYDVTRRKVLSTLGISSLGVVLSACGKDESANLNSLINAGVQKDSSVIKPSLDVKTDNTITGKVDAEITGQIEYTANISEERLKQAHKENLVYIYKICKGYGNAEKGKLSVSAVSGDLTVNTEDVIPNTKDGFAEFLELAKLK